MPSGFHSGNSLSPVTSIFSEETASDYLPYMTDFYPSDYT